VERQQAEAEKAARPVPGAPAARLRPEREESTGGGGRLLVCARCRHPITTEGERIEIDGLHEHTQINPHGYIWNFGCFASAPGCVPVGRPSHEFAWFAGHWWQIEQCGGCGLHLGWLFGSPERRFHGLIVGRLVEDERPHPGGSSPDA
jgi:hypothetical protein